MAIGNPILNNHPLLFKHYDLDSAAGIYSAQAPKDQIVKSPLPVYTKPSLRFVD